MYTSDDPQDERFEDTHDNFDPDWFEATGEPDTETILQANYDGDELEKTEDAQLVRQMANIMRGVLPIDLIEEADFMEEKTDGYTVDKLPTPASFYGLTLQRIELIDTAGENEEAIIDQMKKISDWKDTLRDLELAAIRNWDAKEKKVIDPSRPYNDGSNEDQRKAKARELFLVEYTTIDLLERTLDNLKNKKTRITRRLNILDEIEKYYQWWMRYQLGCK